MAGRDAKKIESVRSDVAKINPKISDVPILVSTEATAHSRPAALLGTVAHHTQTRNTQTLRKTLVSGVCAAKDA